MQENPLQSEPGIRCFEDEAASGLVNQFISAICSPASHVQQSIWPFLASQFEQLPTKSTSLPSSCEVRESGPVAKDQ